MEDQFKNQSHKRFNILTGEWVLVSPHRNNRPWQGQKDVIDEIKLNKYDSECFLCPDNVRSNGEKNPNYESTFVFNNDYAALKENQQSGESNTGLLKMKTESGICKVVCFSPDHSKSLAELQNKEIEHVISVWQDEYKTLGELSEINYVQIFENKGSIMGCSNPHPHGQIWAQNTVPNVVQKKDENQKKYFKENRKSLLLDYLNQELELNQRVLYENEKFVVIIPFWAIWPFETMIIPKKEQANIGDMDKSERMFFADAIKNLTTCYDNLFNCSFPYSSGIHQSPTNELNQSHWQWHMNFYPPLLRSSTIKKFMVGYEMFAMPQRDITPEKAAEILKSKF